MGLLQMMLLQARLPGAIPLIEGAIRSPILPFGSSNFLNSIPSRLDRKMGPDATTLSPSAFARCSSILACTSRTPGSSSPYFSDSGPLDNNFVICTLSTRSEVSTFFGPQFEYKTACSSRFLFPHLHRSDSTKLTLTSNDNVC